MPEHPLVITLEANPTDRYEGADLGEGAFGRRVIARVVLGPDSMPTLCVNGKPFVALDAFYVSEDGRSHPTLGGRLVIGWWGPEGDDGTGDPGWLPLLAVDPSSFV